MSVNSTIITPEISQYLEDNFSAEDKILASIRTETPLLGMPSISISGHQGRTMQMLLKTINAKNVLEIGSLAGYSAIVMARELQDDGKVTCMELNADYCEVIKKNAETAGLSHKIEIINCNASEYLKNYKPKTLFDFIFVDADKNNYMNYLNLTEPMLRSGGIMAFDNSLAFGDVAKDSVSDKEVLSIRKLNEYFYKHPKFFTSLITIGDGLIAGVKMMS